MSSLRSHLIDELIAVNQPPGEIELRLIDPSPYQPRRHWSEDTLLSLAESIVQVGVLEPILVRPVGDRYQLIAGERRVRASRMAGLRTIPAIVHNLSDEDAQRIALVENLQREDLNPIDKIDGILSLCGLEAGMTPEEVVVHMRLMDNDRRRQSSNVTGRPETGKILAALELVGVRWLTFVDQLGALRWPDDVLEAVRSGTLEFTKGKALASIDDDERRAELIQACIDGLSLRQLRQILKPQATPAIALAQQLRRVTPSAMRRLSKTDQRRVEKLLAEIARIVDQ